MSKREALELHYEDEVILKATGRVVVVWSSYEKDGIVWIVLSGSHHEVTHNEVR